MNELAIFNDLFDGLGDDYGFPALNFKKNIHTPKVDVLEEENEYTLEMDLPGKTEDDLNIELNRNVLTISSVDEKHVEEESKEVKNETKPAKKWLMRERVSPIFSRSFVLPEDVDSEALSAEVKNGILKVVMPRKAPVMPKKIKINCA